MLACQDVELSSCWQRTSCTTGSLTYSLPTSCSTFHCALHDVSDMTNLLYEIFLVIVKLGNIKLFSSELSYSVYGIVLLINMSGNEGEIVTCNAGVLIRHCFISCQWACMNSSISFNSVKSQIIPDNSFILHMKTVLR